MFSSKPPQKIVVYTQLERNYNYWISIIFSFVQNDKKELYDSSLPFFPVGVAWSGF